ncbi:MAG: response regulator transcription factor [Planctomycetota bacterium]
MADAEHPPEPEQMDPAQEPVTPPAPAAEAAGAPPSPEGSSPPAGEAAKIPAPESKPKPAAAPPSPPASILVVEDSHPLRNMLQKILGHAGYDVDVAENGEMALAMLRKADPPFALMLLDLMMPIMDGIKVMAQIKKENLPSPPRVLICSSRSDVETVKLVGKLGVAGYVLKPFKTEVVLERVRKTLEAPPSKGL